MGIEERIPFFLKFNHKQKESDSSRNVKVRFTEDGSPYNIRLSSPKVECFLLILGNPSTVHRRIKDSSRRILKKRD